MGTPSRSQKREKNGYILIVTALSIVALLAFSGLAVDAGYLEWNRRRAQTAADSAAMSAMLELKRGSNLSAATTQAQSDAGLNGFTNGTNNTTVVINNPPLYGAYAGNSKYIEAVVTRTVPTMFMQVLGQTSTKISARAVAGVGSSAGGCVYALDTSVDRALDFAGSNTVNLACSAFSESSSSSAYYSEGSITVDLSHSSEVGVVGGYQINNGTYLLDSSNGTNKIPVTVSSPGDPLSYLTAPTSVAVLKTTHTYYDMNAKPAGNLISPGAYCGGLTIGNTGGTTFTLQPGVYVMAGSGFQVQSQGIVNAAGVMIYNTSSTGYACSQSYAAAALSIEGQAQVTWSAPTSGSYAGIAFFEDRTLVTNSLSDQIVGQSTTVINGALYLPRNTLLWSGSNTNSGYMILVADKITVNGNSNLYVNNDYSSLPGGSPVQSGSSAGLAE